MFKNFKELAEAYMQNNRFLKYGKLVIKDIRDGKEIGFGEKEVLDKNRYILPQEDADKLEDIYNNNPEAISDFVFSNGLKWNKIFKGVYSNYQNRGFKVESQIGAEWKEYQKTGFISRDYMRKVLDIAEAKWPECTLVAVREEGSLNKSRKTNVQNGILTIEGDGSILTDCTLVFTDKGGRERELYLSIKAGPSVTFVNLGLKKILKISEMTKCAETGNPKELSNGALQLLNFLGIEPVRFCKIFTEYKGLDQGSSKVKEKQYVDVNLNNKDFKNFLYNLIGYNYVLLHDMGSTVHVLEMTPEKAKKLSSNISKAQVLYPKEGAAKRVDVLLNLDGILEIKLNIRSKDGTVFPTHLMGDYKFLSYDF